MKRATAKTTPRTIPENYRVVGVSCLAGLLIIAAVLLLAAVVISSVDFPQSAIAPVAIGASVAGCFGAGFLCGGMTKSGGLLYGLVCGTVLFLLCLLCELSFFEGSLGMLALYKFVICVASAMIGSVLGVNKRKKVR